MAKEAKIVFEVVTQRVIAEFSLFEEQKIIDLRDVLLTFVNKQVFYLFNSFFCQLFIHIYIYLFIYFYFFRSAYEFYFQPGLRSKILEFFTSSQYFI